MSNPDQDLLDELNLLEACAEANLQTVKQLTKAGTNVNVRYTLPSEHGSVGNNTCLTIAAQQANLSMCKLLVKLGADINAVTNAGYTPLIAALANRADDEVGRYLLRAGANPDPDLVSQLAFSPATTPLVLAATNGMHGIVTELIRRQVRLDRPDGSGWTALKHAAKAGHVGIVKSLIKAGAALDLTDGESWTPLMAAASDGHIEIVKLLLKAGANPNQQRISDEEGETGRTALMDSAFAGHLECVHELLKGGADVNLQMADGRAALHSAIVGVHPEVVAELLSAKADPNLPVAGGITPLQFAIGLIRAETDLPDIQRAGLLQILKLLLGSGADMDFEIVSLAIREGDSIAWLIKALISFGADPNAKNRSGLPALHLVVRYGLKLVAETLLDGGANVMLRSGMGVLAYDISVAYGGPGLARSLIKWMNLVVPAVDRQDTKGRTKLLRAVLAEDLAAVQKAIAQGADASRRDMKGHTPLSTAMEMKLAPIILALRASGAETIKTGDLSGPMAMVKAAQQGALGTVLRLFDEDVSLEVTDKQGNTPLLIAADCSHPGLIRVLVALGANIEHHNAFGQTAHTIADNSSRLYITKILEDLGASVDA